MTDRPWLSKSGFACHVAALGARGGRWLWTHAPGKLRIIGLQMMIFGVTWYALVDIFGLEDALKIHREVKSLSSKKEG